MLIRQKAGWQLHHQAYLWPRKNRAIQLSLSSQPLPRRRQSRNIRCHGRRRRPSLQSGGPSSLPPYTHGVYPSEPPAHRDRKGSSGSEEVDSPLTSISLSTCSGNSIEDLSTTSSPSSKTQSRSGSCERGSNSPERRVSTSTSDDVKDSQSMMTGQRILVQSSLKHWFTVQSRARSDTRAQKRYEKKNLKKTANTELGIKCKTVETNIKEIVELEQVEPDTELTQRRHEAK
ncbi:hypothetical protein Btru_077160 [Bulinus truncatus]|nr:hypothetical protein Btru_077160 [Bulinus truncatus]